MTGSDAAAGSLEREAARHLAEALALVVHLRGREPRERHRRLLEQAIDHAERALAAGGEATWRARSILARAHAARAEDALHWAGQLSLSAQRAPTLDACDEGWRRVEAIVAAAEDASHAAARAAGALVGGPPSVAKAARAAAARADVAGRAARKIVDERNHAYTFHTDRGFSFGEGWYVAAAAVLAGVTVQIEPAMPGTAQAERFLRDAGLGDRLRPYRPRPRANKQTTDLVARAFQADAPGAQRELRAAFLGDASIADAPVATAVSDWIDPRLAGWRDRRKVLVWIRDGAHHPGRNTVHSELVELARRVREAGLLPIVLGDALRHGTVPPGAVDLILFWKEPAFCGQDGRRAQLQLFEHLRSAHGVVGQLGVTTAGMDGPALLGMPTMYLTDAPNVRMRAWDGVVPGYREIVRESGYLERVSAGLTAWGAAGLPGRPVTPGSATTSSGAPR
ncbi:MAG: hypothetical protein ACRELB_07860 [Polyangiaceae bacterium]